MARYKTIDKATAPLRTDQTLITADAGYHSEANMTALAEQAIPELVADIGMRKRDARFKDQDKYKALPDPLYDKAHPKKVARHYRGLHRDRGTECRDGTDSCTLSNSWKSLSRRSFADRIQVPIFSSLAHAK